MDTKDQNTRTPVDHNFQQDHSYKAEAWEEKQPEAYHEYRREWEHGPQVHNPREVPLHLDIEATSACNLKCTMCPRTHKVAEGSFWAVEQFPMDLYCRLVDESVGLGLASIKFQYLGEPTLNKRLPEMILYAKEAGVVDVMFNTNAAKLSREMSRELIEAGVDKVFFSFDSPDPEHYNMIRVGGDFHRTLGNIKAFHEVRAELGKDTPLTRASMVLMPENSHQADAFRELMAPIVDVVGFGTYLDHGSQDEEGRRLVKLRSRSDEEPAFCCPQLYQRMFVHPDGVVTPCCIDSDRALVMGNVNTHSVADIWQGSEYRELRSLHEAGRYAEIDVCRKCPLAKL